MKKALFSSLAIILLTYTAASWYLGVRVESALDAYHRQIGSIAYMSVSDRQYERGVFSATGSLTLELFGDPTRGIEGGAPPRTPLQLTLRSRIRHGPFAAGRLAAAVLESELQLDPETRAEIGRLTGQESLLSGHVVLQFDGSGTGRLSSPAFSTQIPDPDTGETLRLVWGGLHGEMELSPQLDRYSMTGRIPRIEMTNDEGVGMMMIGMHFSADQRRLLADGLADEPLLYVGPQRYSVEEIRIVGDDDVHLALAQIRYDLDTPIQGEFVDLTARMRVDAIESDDGRYGPASCDFSIRHLHSGALAGLYRRLLEVYSDPLQAGTGEPIQQLARVAEPALELLGHRPTIHLDRLSLATPEGELLLEAHASLPGTPAGGFGNPALLLAGLDGQIRITVPKGLLIRLAAERAGTRLAAMSATGALDAADTEMLAAQLEVKLAQLVDQELIQREGDTLVSEITLEAGQLRVNGKPFDATTTQ